jgi:hypothetical protein
LIKFLLRSISVLSMLGGGFLLWQSDIFPEQLPTGLGKWMSVFSGLFHDPIAAPVLFILILFIVIGSWITNELAVGAFYSMTATILAVLCLLGFLSAYYPPAHHYFQTLAK